jgi:hypothetical protein
MRNTYAVTTHGLVNTEVLFTILIYVVLKIFNMVSFFVGLLRTILFWYFFVAPSAQRSLPVQLGSV